MKDWERSNSQGLASDGITLRSCAIHMHTLVQILPSSAGNRKEERRPNTTISIGKTAMSTVATTWMRRGPQSKVFRLTWCFPCTYWWRVVTVNLIAFRMHQESRVQIQTNNTIFSHAIFSWVSGYYFIVVDHIGLLHLGFIWSRLLIRYFYFSGLI
jgi:hypothetical protein